MQKNQIYSLIILTYTIFVNGSPFYQMCYEETNKKRQNQGLPPLQANAVIQMQTQEYANRIAAGLVAVPKVEVQKPHTIFVPQQQNAGINQPKALMFNSNQNTLPKGYSANQADNADRRPYAFHGRRTDPEPNGYGSMQQYPMFYQNNGINTEFNQNPNQNYMHQNAIYAKSNSDYMPGNYMPISNGNPNPALGNPQNYMGQMQMPQMNLNGQIPFNDATRAQNLGGNYATMAGRNQAPVLPPQQNGNPNALNELMSGNNNGAIKNPQKIFFESPEEMSATLKSSVKMGCAIAKNPNGGAIVIINYQ